MANSYFAAQNRIRSGELRAGLPENATAEQLAAWREENGIPAEAKDYALPEGIVFGEDDTPFIDSFKEAALAANYTPAQFQSALAWYHADREAQIEALATQDTQHLAETVEQMTAHWGQEATRNKNMVNALIDTAPPEVAERLRAARGPEDRALLNDFGVLEWLQSLAFQINPMATIVPNASGNVMSAVEDEIAKWEGMMGDRKSEYWSGPKAEANQARLRELYAYRESQKGKK